MASLKKINLIVLASICLISMLIPLDVTIGPQLTEMLKVTLSVYAVLRGLNAVISVAQGTELSIEPMGVGVTLTPGELLDPLNDLIEQVSSILLFASASIGIQKIILNLSDIDMFRWLLAGLMLISLLAIGFKKVSSSKQTMLIKVIVVVSLLRLMVPAMVLTSSLMQGWLSVDRQQSISVLKSTEQEVRTLNDSTAKDTDSSWFETLGNKLKVTELFHSLQAKTTEAVTAAVNILAEFLLVFIFIPMLFLLLAYWCIKKAVSSSTERH